MIPDRHSEMCFFIGGLSLFIRNGKGNFRESDRLVHPQQRLRHVLAGRERQFLADDRVFLRCRGNGDLLLAIIDRRAFAVEDVQDESCVRIRTVFPRQLT